MFGKSKIKEALKIYEFESKLISNDENVKARLDALENFITNLKRAFE